MNLKMIVINLWVKVQDNTNIHLNKMKIIQILKTEFHIETEIQEKTQVEMKMDLKNSIPSENSEGKSFQ